MKIFSAWSRATLLYCISIDYTMKWHLCAYYLDSATQCCVFKKLFHSAKEIRFKLTWTHVCLLFILNKSLLWKHFLTIYMFISLFSCSWLLAEQHNQFWADNREHGLTMRNLLFREFLMIQFGCFWFVTHHGYFSKSLTSWKYSRIFLTHNSYYI